MLELPDTYFHLGAVIVALFTHMDSEAPTLTLAHSLFKLPVMQPATKSFGRPMFYALGHFVNHLINEADRQE
eukprot:6486308-Amphidinium_carterae.1